MEKSVARADIFIAVKVWNRNIPQPLEYLTHMERSENGLLTINRFLERDEIDLESLECSNKIVN